MSDSRRKRSARGERSQNPAARVDGLSPRIFRKSREIPATAGSAFRGNSRCAGEIKRRRVINVQKSAKTTLDWGEWAQNKAARIDGQPHRICRGSREIPVIAGSAFRWDTRCKGEIKRGRAGNVQKSAKKRR